MTTLESLEKKMEILFSGLISKIEDLEIRIEAKFDEKIDELAAMTARGFLEVATHFERVEGRLEIIEDNYATKDDLFALSKNVDVMLDKHIGVFREDYNDLAKRTKNLEKAVFAV